jgi:hypothetical protein
MVDQAVAADRLLLAAQEIRPVFFQVRVVTAAHLSVLAHLIMDAAEGEVHLR